MKKILFGLFIFGLTSQGFSQIVKTEQLSEVVVTAVNYKYLNAVDSEDLALDVKLLQEKVAMYDIKNSDLYSDEYNLYNVDFFIPDGKILAAYDKDGKILRTIEKFNNIKLPKVILESIYNRFPGWTIAKNVYSVTYNENNNKKVFKVTLENGDQRMRLKLNDEGNFL